MTLPRSEAEPEVAAARAGEGRGSDDAGCGERRGSPDAGCGEGRGSDDAGCGERRGSPDAGCGERRGSRDARAGEGGQSRDARVGPEGAGDHRARGGRNDAERVRRSVELDAAPVEVWEALTEEALLAEWLADEVKLEAEPGGAIRCRYADGEERRGEVELVEEAERLAWSWRREGGGPSRVEVVLDAVAGRTRLTVIETAPVRTDGPLLLAGTGGPRRRAGLLLAAPAGPAAHGATWSLPLARLRAAVSLVHA